MQTGIRLATGAALLLLLGWAGAGWLKPLGSMIPNTRAMLGTTRQILAETQGLQEEVERVRVSLSQVQQQERLLDEQQALMAGLLQQMKEQEQLAAGTTRLMRSILEAERTTAALTREADQAGLAAMGTVSASAVELEQLAAAARRIKGGSRTVDGQMDRLLIALEGSAENFAVVARTREAAGRTVDRSVNWWNWVKGMWPWGR